MMYDFVFVEAGACGCATADRLQRPCLISSRSPGFRGPQSVPVCRRN